MMIYALVEEVIYFQVGYLYEPGCKPRLVARPWEMRNLPGRLSPAGEVRVLKRTRKGGLKLTRKVVLPGRGPNLWDAGPYPIPEFEGAFIRPLELWEADQLGLRALPHPEGREWKEWKEE